MSGLRDAVSEWLESYYAASPKTIAIYRDAIETKMLGHLEGQQGLSELDEVTPKHLTLFLVYEWERPRKRQRRDGDRAEEGRISREVIVRIYEVMRTFWKWAVGQGYIARNPMEGVRKPAKSRLTRTAVSSAEAARMVASMREKDDPIVAARDEAILTLFLGTGLRVNALRNLRLGDIDWANRRLHIRDDKGEGLTQKRVRLSPKAYTALRKWLRMRDRYKVSSDALWISIQRRPMSYQAFWHVVRTAGEYAGVEGAVHPHRLRHTAATELYRETRDIMKVKAFLGHSKVQTTERYLTRLGIELEDADYRTPDEWLT